jgi:hypothetical protein
MDKNKKKNKKNKDKTNSSDLRSIIKTIGIFIKQFKKWIRTISKVDQENLSNYKGDYYSWVNRALLNGTLPEVQVDNTILNGYKGAFYCLPHSIQDIKYYIASKTLQICGSLDYIFTQPMHIPSDLILYRGINGINWRAGDTITIPSYQSYSLNRDVAMRFIGAGQDCCLIILNIAKGVPCIYLPWNTKWEEPMKETPINDEMEILLPRNGQIRVVKKIRMPKILDKSKTYEQLMKNAKHGKMTVYFCEWIGQGPSSPLPDVNQLASSIHLLKITV